MRYHDLKLEEIEYIKLDVQKNMTRVLSQLFNFILVALRIIDIDQFFSAFF